MTIPNRLRSRKLWVTVGTIVSVVASQYLGIEISPEALAGLAGTVLVYVGGQSFVDAKTAKAEAELYRDETIQSLTLMVGQLQQRLQSVYAAEQTGDPNAPENPGQYV